MNSTLTMTSTNFRDTLKTHDIVLLDFWASWCGPCRMFGPTFEKVAAKHPDIAFGKVNTETELELASSFNIRSIPTLMAFRDGILIFSQPGALPEAALEDLIRQIRELDMAKVKAEVKRSSPTADVH